MSEENKDHLWTAVRRATHTAHVPRLDHAGQYVLEAVTYIDSQQLQLTIKELLQVQLSDGNARLKSTCSS